jgi:hypothetical protein
MSLPASRRFELNQALRPEGRANGDVTVPFSSLVGRLSKLVLR